MILMRTPRGKLSEATQMWPVIIIASVVLGGIYSGWFTPTEAAAAGALITLLFGWFLGSLRKFGDVTGAMKDSANTTAMLFLINIGALYYSRVLAVTGLPSELTMLLQDLEVPRIVILLGILGIMFLLGMIMVPVGIYALTLPVVFPMLVSLGYDPIWFGVIALKLTEIGSITPPVGLNVYAMKGVIPERYEYIPGGCFQRSMAILHGRYHRPGNVDHLSSAITVAAQAIAGLTFY